MDVREKCKIRTKLKGLCVYNYIFSHILLGYIDSASNTLQFHRMRMIMSTQEDNLLGFGCHSCSAKFQSMNDATNHLKTEHTVKDGDSIQCMISQTNNMFCSVSCTSFKALKQHMKRAKCKLLSSDTSDLVSNNGKDENLSEKWDMELDDFGNLFISSSKATEVMRHSMEECTEEFVNKLIISNVPHTIVDDAVKFSKELVCKTIAMIEQSMADDTSKNDMATVLSSTEQLVTSQLSKLETRYKRGKSIAARPHYVAPRSISVEDGRTFQYVPITNTLEMLFSN